MRIQPSYNQSFICPYSFQAQEHDDEVKGDGNSFTTQFRQYDPRLGRWLSIDPLSAKFPRQSPYVAFDNNPIFYKDPKGLAAEGGEGEDIKEPSSKELNKISRRVERVQKASEKLSKKEREMAEQYANKTGGVADSRIDSDGNTRWSVWAERSEDEAICSPRTDFNDKEWGKIADTKNDIVETCYSLFGPNGNSAFGTPADVIGVGSTITFTDLGGDYKVHSETHSIFFITKGPDFGLWTADTYGSGYGCQFEASFNVFAGIYWGGDPTASSLEGKGWSAGADVLGGLSAWGSFQGDSGYPGWTGVAFSFGGSLGVSGQETNTSPLIRY